MADKNISAETVAEANRHWWKLRSAHGAGRYAIVEAHYEQRWEELRMMRLEQAMVAVNQETIRPRESRRNEDFCSENELKTSWQCSLHAGCECEAMGRL